MRFTRNVQSRGVNFVAFPLGINSNFCKPDFERLNESEHRSEASNVRRTPKLSILKTKRLRFDVMDSDLSLIEISGEDDSPLRLEDPSNCIFSCSPFQAARSTQSDAAPDASSAGGMRSVQFAEKIGDRSSKENTDVKAEGMKLNMDPLQMKRRKRTAGYNMRKSLAWNKAFFTEEGVLDPEELSLVTGSFNLSSGEPLSVIQERRKPGKSNRPHLQSPKEKMLMRSPGIGRGLSPRCDSSTRHHVSAVKEISSPHVRRLELSAHNANRKGEKLSGCPRPAPSSSYKRPATANASNATSKEPKLTKSSVPRADRCSLPMVSRSGLPTTSSSSRILAEAKRVVSAPKSVAISVKSSMTNTRGAKGPMANTRCDKGLVANTRGVKGIAKSLTSANPVPSKESAQLPGRNKSELPPKAPTPRTPQVPHVSLLKSAPPGVPDQVRQEEEGSNKHNYIPLPQKCSHNVAQKQSTHVTAAKPTGLRMPSPSLGFFGQPKQSVSLRDPNLHNGSTSSSSYAGVRNISVAQRPLQAPGRVAGVSNGILASDELRCFISTIREPVFIANTVEMERPTMSSESSPLVHADFLENCSQIISQKLGESNKCDETADMEGLCTLDNLPGSNESNSEQLNCGEYQGMANNECRNDLKEKLSPEGYITSDAETQDCSDHIQPIICDNKISMHGCDQQPVGVKATEKKKPDFFEAHQPNCKESLDGGMDHDPSPLQLKFGQNQGMVNGACQDLKDSLPIEGFSVSETETRDCSDHSQPITCDDQRSMHGIDQLSVDGAETRKHGFSGAYQTNCQERFDEGLNYDPSTSLLRCGESQVIISGSCRQDQKGSLSREVYSFSVVETQDSRDYTYSITNDRSVNDSDRLSAEPAETKEPHFSEAHQTKCEESFDEDMDCDPSPSQLKHGESQGIINGPCGQDPKDSMSLEARSVFEAETQDSGDSIQPLTYDNQRSLHESDVRSVDRAETRKPDSGDACQEICEESLDGDRYCDPSPPDESAVSDVKENLCSSESLEDYNLSDLKSTSCVSQFMPLTPAIEGSTGEDTNNKEHAAFHVNASCLRNHESSLEMLNDKSLGTSYMTMDEIQVVVSGLKAPRNEPNSPENLQMQLETCISHTVQEVGVFDEDATNCSSMKEQQSSCVEAELLSECKMPYLGSQSESEHAVEDMHQVFSECDIKLQLNIKDGLGAISNADCDQMVNERLLSYGQADEIKLQEVSVLEADDAANCSNMKDEQSSCAKAEFLAECRMPTPQSESEHVVEHQIFSECDIELQLKRKDDLVEASNANCGEIVNEGLLSYAQIDDITLHQSSEQVIEYCGAESDMVIEESKTAEFVNYLNQELLILKSMDDHESDCRLDASNEFKGSDGDELGYSSSQLAGLAQANEVQIADASTTKDLSGSLSSAAKRSSSEICHQDTSDDWLRDVGLDVEYKDSQEKQSPQRPVDLDVCELARNVTKTTSSKEDTTCNTEVEHIQDDISSTLEESGVPSPCNSTRRNSKSTGLVIKPPPNAVPFSEEWLAAIEAAGEDILTLKSGAVQHSPPDKSVPEPSPWSPVKRHKNQGIGPFDCTKHTNLPPPPADK